MKQKICGLILSFVVTLSSFAGPGYQINWTKQPFEQRVFVENVGQFNSLSGSSEKVFYSAQLGRVHAYFTSAGVVYRYDECLRTEENEKEREGEGEREGASTNTFFVSCLWDNCNPNVSISPQEKQQDYYTYTESTGSLQANIYKKITYKNIYDGIDIEYFFPDNMDGIKYNIIVHPGADYSRVMLKYKEASKIFVDKAGNAVIKTRMGDFTEHAPVTFVDKKGISSSYRLRGSTILFSCDASSITNSGTLIIDPWISNPLFASVNKALDIDYDDAGNVYAYGSLNPFQLVKFNSSGTKLWTCNVTQTTGCNYGCFAVDKTTGTSYVFQGSAPNPAADKVFKINSSGVLVKKLFSVISLEFWRATYDRCNHQLVIGSGGWYTSGAQISTVDTNLTAIKTYNPLNVIGCCYDACLLAMDPGGSTCYLTMTNGTGSNNIPYNSLSQLPLTSLGNPIYKNIKSGYHFFECSIVYGKVQQCGFNGMAASNSWLYMWDGSTLKKLNKSNGAAVLKNVVNNPTYWYYPNTFATDTVINTYWGGLDVDMCDNVYVGNKKSIDIYNSSLSLTSSIALPDTVYDVKLPQDFKHIYAGGKGFVTCINLAPPVLSLTHTNSSNCACTGTATANISACTTSGVQYLWSNGQTTQMAVGLCPATYSITATLTGPACSPIQMTFTDTVTIKGGGVGAASANNATICAGQTATLSAAGGGNYSWNTGSTDASISVTPNVTTTYTVIVSTGNCKDTAFAIVTIKPFSPISAAGNTTICVGSTTTLSASGGINYSWSTGATTASISVSPAVNSTYTVVSTDGLTGCVGTSTVSVAVLPPPVATATSVTVCAGQSATLSAAGGGNYLWSNGATGSSITVTASAPANYSVVVSIGTCSDTASAAVAVTTAPVIALGEVQMLCPGESITLDAGNAGAGYLWSTGSTDETISVSSPGTYWVVVGSAHCLGKDSVKIIVTPSIHLPDSSLCTMSPITLDPGSGASSYQWSNGSLSQTISVDVAGTYWVQALFGNCLSSDTAHITGEAGNGSLYIPNAFTPNDDGLNETFSAKGTGITAFSMDIFDRWGNRIFASGDINNGWDGKVEGHYILKADGNKAAQEDVYVWKVDYKTQCFPTMLQKMTGVMSLVK